MRDLYINGSKQKKCVCMFTKTAGKNLCVGSWHGLEEEGPCGQMQETREPAAAHTEHARDTEE